MTLNYVQLADSITTIAELLDSPIYNFVTLDENDCGYEGKTEYLIVNYVHPLSLKATAAASQADNPNQRQAMDDQFADEYWEADVTELETLKSMSAWKVVCCEDYINVIRST